VKAERHSDDPAERRGCGGEDRAAASLTVSDQRAGEQRSATHVGCHTDSGSLDKK
jgi:hypothetical protein